MKEFLTIDSIKEILTPNEIMSGLFGLEKEGLRVNKDAKLALTPHPNIFGDKLTNPYITTDFSESQIEIVTPTFNTIEESYQSIIYNRYCKY